MSLTIQKENREFNCSGAIEMFCLSEDVLMVLLRLVLQLIKLKISGHVFIMEILCLRVDLAPEDPCIFYLLPYRERFVSQGTEE